MRTMIFTLKKYYPLTHGERSDSVLWCLSFLRKAHSTAGGLGISQSRCASTRPRSCPVFCFLARAYGDIGRTAGLWEEFCAAWRRSTADKWGVI